MTVFLTKLRAANILSQGVFLADETKSPVTTTHHSSTSSLSLTRRPTLMACRLRSRISKVEFDQPPVQPSVSCNVVQFELPMPRSISQLRAEPPPIIRSREFSMPVFEVEVCSRQAQDPSTGSSLGCLQPRARYLMASLRKSKHPSPLCVLKTDKCLLSLI
jgi:hypothetical protein